jgi:hypothetical protein
MKAWFSQGASLALFPLSFAHLFYSPCGSSLAAILFATVSGLIDDKTMYPQSVKMTARVLLPQVASIRVPRSLASCIVRFIGADSFDTSATILLASTALPNPMLINLCELIGTP